jgi:hypothetical protein
MSKYRTPRERMPEYPIWLAMRQRCNNPNHPKYHRYGGRGIKICERWDDFNLFLKDMGQRPSAEYSIERVNNDGNYEPTNCVWKLLSYQARNTSLTTFLTHNGVTKSLSDWADTVGISAHTIYHRLYRGASLERALTPEFLGRNQWHP